MKDIRPDVLVITRHEFTRFFIEHDQAGRIGRGDMAVRVIHAVRGVGVQKPSVQQRRAVSRVVLAHVEFRDHVIAPQDIGIIRGRLNRRLAGRHTVAGFVHERPVVTVCHAGGIETQHLATAADHIDAVALDRRRRADAAAGPIPIDAGGDFRHNQLPEELAGALVKTHQHAAITGVTRIARPSVVGTDVDASASHNRRGMGLGTDLSDPAHVAAAFKIE